MSQSNQLDESSERREPGLLQNDMLFWGVQVLLLAPLAVFWISVITRSEELSQLLFGPRHTPFRDLMPTVFLPAIALGLSLFRLRGRATSVDEPERGGRAGTVIAAALAAVSLLVVLGYAVSENLADASRAAGS
ncbi:MAG: hypothetical protein ABR543_00860 [Gemmatimonadaceae bacterium]